MTGAPMPLRDGTGRHPSLGRRRDGGVRFGIAYGPRTDWPDLRDFRAGGRGARVRLLLDDGPSLSGFDCWSSLAALAAATTRLRLGPLVSCVYYRSPAQLARLAADVDRISGGRLVLGLGVGNHEREFAKLGSRSPHAARLAGPSRRRCGSCAGSGARPRLPRVTTSVSAAMCDPAPAQRPHVPLLIAGGGERVTLRQVAAFADAANFSPHGKAGSAFAADDVRRKLAALRRHCEVLGRPTAILRTQVAVPVVLAETRAALAAKLAAIPEASAVDTRRAWSPARRTTPSPTTGR